MKEKYGVQKYQSLNEPVDMNVHAGGGGVGTRPVKTRYAYYEIVWYDTLEEAVKNANGEPVIRSVAYSVVPSEQNN